MNSSRNSTTPLAVPTNKCILATCNLNQWALDFDGNLERIIASIRRAKQLGAKYRLGPELEVSGYSCEDHFLELDTMMHCDQSLAAILEGDLTDGILCDIGCPILHNNVRYNCRVFCLNRKIVLIRPKISLADDGNYREKRFFASWDHTDKALHDHLLSDLLRKITNQTVVPMGIGIIATEETTIASEMCEELWTVRSPHISYFLSGVEIISNGSGSHHVLRKLDARLTLMKEPTRKCGGVYLYSNQRGCDGNRLYFDGCSLVCVNGEVVAQASQFSLNDVEVITAVVDLDVVRSYRQDTASFQEQSSYERQLPTVDLRHFSLRHVKTASYEALQEARVSLPIKPRIHLPEEECAMGPACWLWDYLRRSGASGYMLPLSGGADSAAVAAIVRVMCMMAADAALAGNTQVIADIRKMFSNNNASSEVMDEVFLRSEQLTTLTASRIDALTTDSSYSQITPVSVFDDEDEGVGSEIMEKRLILANELCYQIMHTVYLGTSNSSTNTLDRAKRLAGAIRSYHNSVVIDDIVSAVLRVFSAFAGRTPKFVAQGGSMAEDLALQNIQARLRMVMSYLCAQLFPWLRGNKGFLLVLSSGNVDEALRGYMTKYDCSSGDLNPIGGISKVDLKRMLTYLSGAYKLPVLDEIANAVPTAELRPIDEDTDRSESTQTDEEEMGMTYSELGVFGFLRKVMKCGPVRMFLKLVDMWRFLTPDEVAVKVKRFFFYYSVNRHKLTTLTPSYHAEGYSPDDNRYDLRQFLYNVKWTRQFNTIDSILNTTYNIKATPLSITSGASDAVETA
mmetsp:Transcript_78360/g.153838  ORF Transcript_78360/g.153838 Transcript_78360/m.153838 type:complete len:795 (+) Transcript_78360:17-2401(+)